VNDAYLVTSLEGPHAAIDPLGTAIVAYPLDGGAPSTITRLSDASGFAWKP